MGGAAMKMGFRSWARLATLALVLAGGVSVAGCGQAVSRIDAERVSNLWDTLGPRQREYIAKDPLLANDPASRQKRIETVDRMDQAVKDLKGSAR
jgi:hypothetical protein